MTDSMADREYQAPAWMTRVRPSPVEKKRVALSWTGEHDPRFVVPISQLRELVADGFLPTSRYYFKAVSPTLGKTEFNAWCRKLGSDLHRLVSARVDPLLAVELGTYAQEVGNVSNWTQGFVSLFAYLDAVSDLTDIDFGDLSIEGRPGNPLLNSGHVIQAEAGATTRATVSNIREPHKVVHEMLQQEHNVIVEGVAGSGKSHLLDSLRPLYDHVEVTVFHPSTSYEEFVSGLRPSHDGRFEGTAGVFVRACDRAASAPQARHLLFIDEINRANTSRVFGDLLLILERSKRVSVHALGGHALLKAAPETGVSVTLQTPIGGDHLRHLVVPDNLYVLGTMNSTDRSVGTIDLALRRRFAWYGMEPMTSDELAEHHAFRSKLDDEAPDVVSEWKHVVNWYDQTNATLLDQIGPDARLGHSYILSASSPLGAARGLVSQLAEIAFTFNLSPEVLDEMPAIELPTEAVSLTATYRGQGLGRRPSVEISPLSSVSVTNGEVD